MRKFLFASSALVLAFAATTATAARNVLVPGLSIEAYATVDGPVGLSFAPDGTLYAGVASPTETPTPIWKISPGGGSVTAFGPGLNDPDSVLYDADGSISGVPGSVLVAGGLTLASTEGRLTAVHPDETSTLLIQSTDLDNPNDMEFDSTGRLLISNIDDDLNTTQILEYNTAGPSLTQIASHTNLGGALAVAVDASDNVFSEANDGIIRKYASDGTLIDGSFFTGLGTNRAGSLEIGPGFGPFGSSLYTVHTETGDLLQIDPDTGAATTIGTGFDETGFGAIQTDITFGPDGFMYISYFNTDEVIRIVPEPSALALFGLAGFAMLRRRR